MGLSPLVLLQLSAEDGPRVALTAAVVSTGHGEERVRGEASGRSVEDGACCEGKRGAQIPRPPPDSAQLRRGMERRHPPADFILPSPTLV